MNASKKETADQDRLLDPDAPQPENKGNTPVKNGSPAETKQEKNEGEKKDTQNLSPYLNAYMAQYGMDSTAVIEFEIINNTKYSEEIIDGARADYDPFKLESLKSQTDLTEFYSEGKKQILSQWRADRALNTHNDRFCVLLQINIGTILNLVEPTFAKKRDYTAWVATNFKDHQSRYFQQAKQLALMGDFAKENSAAGKNRLLALDSLRKIEKKAEFETLLGDHPLPDIAKDDDGKLLKSHLDAVITLHRLTNEGLRGTTFEQAELIASFDNEAIDVAKAKEVAKWLNLNPEDQRPALFARLIQDRMAYPSDNPYTPAPKASLGKVLSDLLNNYGATNLEDAAWIARQRQLQVMESLLAAQRLIAQLIDRIGVEAPAAEVTTETPTE